MKTQTIINCAFAGAQTFINFVFVVVFIWYAVLQRNPTFDTITCKKWIVVDADGKQRIVAEIFADKRLLSGVTWRDKDGKGRIMAGTDADGNACLQCADKNERVRITAATTSNGNVLLPTVENAP